MKKENKKVEEKEIMEKEEVKETGLMIKDFGELENAGRSKTDVFTTITDSKLLFNLDNHCDYKLNDCKGEVIRVKDILIKVIKTPLDEPEVDENGVVTKDMEIKKVCILIDDEGKSYVTGSKMFTNQMVRYIGYNGIQSIQEGLEIKIIERDVKGTSNKALGFDLV
jgi:hypothetical protein